MLIFYAWKEKFPNFRIKFVLTFHKMISNQFLMKMKLFLLA